MKRIWMACISALLPWLADAEVAPVAVTVPAAHAWMGQRVPFFIELRAPGSFVGTARFELPQLPGTTILKIGSPVVSSQQFDDASWFVQTHEFALFSQRPGRLDVPAFGVQFEARDGFTGPAHPIRAQTSLWQVEIRRPPGSDGIGFLITTESLDVSQSWDPPPGAAELGAVFERTVVQHAQQVPGMALAPLPATAPDGVRSYPGRAATSDQLARGNFIGERRDTLRYQLTIPGAVTLPALTYVWWNPTTQQLLSKTLPSATIDVAAPPASMQGDEATVAHSFMSWPWIWLMGAALVVGTGIAQRRYIRAMLRSVWRALNPPERAAARRLLHACARHDADAAAVAWRNWRNIQPAPFTSSDALDAAIIELRRVDFSASTTTGWRGDSLALAVNDYIASAKAQRGAVRASSLAPLNP